jgi:hypothetical protein
VEITGLSAAGDYAPIVNANRAQVMGKSLLPATAPNVTLTALLSGAYDGQWVEVEAVFHAVWQSGKNVSLELALSDGTITATTLEEAGADYGSLVDAEVRLRGRGLFGRLRFAAAASLRCDSPPGSDRPGRRGAQTERYGEYVR